MNPTVTAAAISAVTAAGATMLAARPHHDLIRSAGIVSVLVGAVGAAYALADRRLCRMESLGIHIVTTERGILDALEPDDDDLP
ncbi:hypothetical protein [Streptomyces sp.]|uniref:hypothetical protein n=1 Tax=Streptomyces sp. TaxID=1931 RepID=UPI002F925F4E